jgi:hypothetical protein
MAATYHIMYVRTSPSILSLPKSFIISEEIIKLPEFRCIIVFLSLEVINIFSDTFIKHIKNILQKIKLKYTVVWVSILLCVSRCTLAASVV